MDIGGGGGGAGNSENLGGLGHAPPDNFKIQSPRNTISSVRVSDILQKSALQIRSMGTS